MMSATDKLNLLISKSKASVTVSVNGHKDCYLTAAQDITNSKGDPQSLYEDVSAEVLKEMAKRNEIIYVQFYPRTPVSFYSVAHYDLDMALDECLDILSEIELEQV
jgi:hypothetical protein